jgi:DNA modification methylase
MYDCNIDQTSRIRGKIVKKMGFNNQKDFKKNSNDEQKIELETELSKRLENKKERSDNRDKGNSWFVPYDTISNKSQKGSHPAIYPIKLVEDCILVRLLLFLVHQLIIRYSVTYMTLM